MKKGMLSVYCQNNNWETNTWIAPEELDYIALESDGNHFFDKDTMKIYFDTTNELIKIKYYLNNVALTSYPYDIAILTSKVVGFSFSKRWGR